MLCLGDYLLVNIKRKGTVKTYIKRKLNIKIIIKDKIETRIYFFYITKV